MILCCCLDLHPHPHQEGAPACVSQRLRATLGERCRHITIINAGGDAGRDKDREGGGEESAGSGDGGGRQEPGVERRLVKTHVCFSFRAQPAPRLASRGREKLSTGADRLCVCVRTHAHARTLSPGDARACT